MAVESEQRDALVPLVLAGAGTAFLPRAVAATAAAQGAVVRRTRPRIERHVVLVHRPETLAPAGRALVGRRAPSDRCRICVEIPVKLLVHGIPPLITWRMRGPAA